MAVSSLISRAARTGAKQSLEDQLWGSRFLRMRMRYLVRWGLLLLSFFIFDMAIVGRGFSRILFDEWNVVVMCGGCSVVVVCAGVWRWT